MHRFKPLHAFVILIGVAVILVVADGIATYNNDIASCERGKLVRQDLTTLNRVTKKFLKTAERARRSSAQIDRQENHYKSANANFRAAQQYRWLASQLSYTKSPVCEDIIPRPFIYLGDPPQPGDPEIPVSDEDS